MLKHYSQKIRIVTVTRLHKVYIQQRVQSLETQKKITVFIVYSKYYSLYCLYS